ncbi:unnamed protein product, partial [Laminaria digitata]
IPPVPISVSGVPTTSQQSTDGEFATRGRFRRSRSAVPVESPLELRERFWTGVKLPTRKKSNLLPTLTGSNRITMATVRAAIKLKKKANVIQAKSVLNWSILDPRSPRMRSWKNWMFMNIMYTVLVVPWRISFNLPAQAFGLTLSGIANVSFIIDTVLHFFTAVETESGLVTDHGIILRQYLSSWFIIDLVTCLPYTTLLRDSIPASLRVLTPLRGLRLLSLLKVAKVYAMHYEVSPVAMSIGKTLVTVILAAHLLSCLWFWMNCFEALDALAPKPWTQCGLPHSAASQYLASFYFIIYTMMTVGYGDQHAEPSSKKGLLLSLIIQLTGATLFGFIIAATRRIVQFIAPIQKVTITNLQKISEYAVDRRLPDGVTSRIKRHFRYFYFKTSVFDEQVVMAHVPWQVSHEVMATTHRVALAATSLLQDQDFSPAVLMRLARAMKPMELDSNQEAARQGDIVLQVYFVIKGRIEAYVNERDGDRLAPDGEDARHSLREASYLGVWGPGSIWGLNNVLLGGFSEATFVAASQTDLLWIDQVDLIAVIDDHDEIRACLEKTGNTERQALQEAAGSATITKEGLKLKQISLTDFKVTLSMFLKRTAVNDSTCRIWSV